MNSNLKNYLDYYTKLENPGYALLITGGWGSGKTYQINKYFERKKDDICYVSLFGINSIQDIYSSIFI
ncbi:P-loop NTPase fold protein, partial [Morganella morganii]